MNGGTAAWLIVAGFAIFLLAGAFGCWVGYGLGLDHAARDEADQLEAQIEGRHRAGGPQVTTLLELPRRPGLELTYGAQSADTWVFFGGAQVEPQPGAAEYELMTRGTEVWADRNAGRFDSAPPPGPCADLSGSAPEGALADETPSAFTRRMAAEVGAMIAGWEAQGNYDRHLIYARDRT